MELFLLGKRFPISQKLYISGTRKFIIDELKIYFGRKQRFALGTPDFEILFNKKLTNENVINISYFGIHLDIITKRLIYDLKQKENNSNSLINQICPVENLFSGLTSFSYLKAFLSLSNFQES